MESAGPDPSRPMTDEAAKRNTDCVYFLASPLTCKKGNECEYRHSEGARVNPRDCWFWLNGNCLNPKCSFRHPPLDGFVGAPITAHPASTLPLTQTATSTQVTSAPAPATHPSNKQSIPCYYFQKGGCLKGERCPFMHDVQPSNNPVTQQTAKVATPAMETTSALKGSPWVLENYAQHNLPKASSDKPVMASQTSSKVDVKAETVLTSALPVKSSTVPSALSNETSHTVPPANFAYSTSDVLTRLHAHLEPLNEQINNGRDADESLRESSPGFDVLVDDECEDTSYFHVDGGDTSSHEVNNLNMVNDFDYHHSSTYNSVGQFERETHKTHNEVGEYDQYGRHDRYQDDCRYSERIMERASMHDKRGSDGDDFPNEIGGSDLRHRLLKKRKINVLQSTINTDHRCKPYQKDDHHAEKQRYRSRNSGRDQHRFPHESSISKRLQGRITLPGRPPSDNPSNMHSERERDKGKDWARSSSPGQSLNCQGKLHDRIVRRMHEDSTPKPRNLEGQPRRDEADSLNFAGPKSLAELKGSKFSNDTKDTSSKIKDNTVTLEQRNLRLNKALEPTESEGSLPFEGPKPLSEILKRKREAALGNDATSLDGHGNDHKVTVDDAGDSMISATTDSQNICLLESQNGGHHTASKPEVPKSTVVVEKKGPSITDGEELPHTDQSSAKKDMLEGVDDIPADNTEDNETGAYDQRDGEFEYEIAEGTDLKAEDSDDLSHPDQSSHKEEMLGSEDGMVVENIEDSEENYDQRDAEYEYDAVEGTDFRTYDENDQKDEDYVDDEDDDDFARKIGVMFS